jgi:anti-anti-sigma factor
MPTRELQVTVLRSEGAPVLDLVGDVDANAEGALTSAYTQATADAPGSLTLNFARTDYINSTGIALIVGLLAQARAQGVAITATGLSDHYREIFEITRLADFMTIADDEKGAARGAEGSGNA